MNGAEQPTHAVKIISSHSTQSSPAQHKLLDDDPSHLRAYYNITRSIRNHLLRLGRPAQRISYPLLAPTPRRHARISGLYEAHSAQVLPNLRLSWCPSITSHHLSTKPLTKDLARSLAHIPSPIVPQPQRSRRADTCVYAPRSVAALERGCSSWLLISCCISGSKEGRIFIVIGLLWKQNEARNEPRRSY